LTLVADHVTGTTVTFKRRRWLDRVLGGVGQEGVLEAGDFKVGQRVAGGANMSVDIAPGDAFVDIDSGTKSGRAHVDSDAIENRAVAASHATLPRIDLVVLDYNDTSIPAGSGGGNAPTLRVLTGTPTAAVTQDAPGVSPPNLPADALLQVDSGALLPRVECSGAPLRVRFAAREAHNSAGVTVYWAPWVDGTGPDGVTTVESTQVATHESTREQSVPLDYPLLPAAGSHLIGPAWRTGLGVVTVYGRASIPAVLTLEEILRQNADNT
jgi:hypothetical protein